MFVDALGQVAHVLAHIGLEVGQRFVDRGQRRVAESWQRAEDRVLPFLPAHLQNLVRARPVIEQALRHGHFHVVASMLGPAWRGFVLQVGKHEVSTQVPAGYTAHFGWDYTHDHPDLRRLYEAAKRDQWNGTTALDWSQSVDPQNTERPILPDSYLPMSGLAVWRGLSPARQADQRHAMLAWVLSQILHGEQGALMAAAQVTSAVPWLDAKLFGGTQVVDEARHVEVFHRYLGEKLQRRYHINDNLYVLIDALMNTAEWDLKFLGMQIMIEGLAMGAFGTLRRVADEELLRGLLKYVITDEARHVHYGVLALERFYGREISERERCFREDWAFEVARLMRDRFLAHEIYEEYYGHAMTRREWDRLISQSGAIDLFRQTMFRRIMPNLRRIGLLSPRILPYYDELGVMEYATGKATPDLSPDEILEG